MIALVPPSIRAAAATKTVRACMVALLDDAGRPTGRLLFGEREYIPVRAPRAASRALAA